MKPYIPSDSVENYYQKQVRLLLEILPEINHHPSFALKGGTAINLFLRDFPRLSVDIDLTYLPLSPREQFLLELSNELETLAQSIEDKGNDYRVMREYTKSENQLYRLRVNRNFVTVKIEPNLVLRGSVYPVDKLSISPSVREEYFVNIDINCLSFADIYAGKLCAALDRQHPRDLFDIKLLLENEGITPEIQQAFVVYIASSSRPMHELLNPTLLDVHTIYENQFIGMTRKSIDYDSLATARQTLISTLRANLTGNERQFLLSFKQGKPNWSLMPFSHLQDLPALKWKLRNIQVMDENKKKIMIDKLKSVLEL